MKLEVGLALLAELTVYGSACACRSRRQNVARELRRRVVVNVQVKDRKTPAALTAGSWTAGRCQQEGTAAS